MARQEEDNYWTSSGAKGFDFDSDDVPADNYFTLFGTSQTQTTQLSQQLKQNLGPVNQSSHQKLKHSISQSSLSSESSLGSSTRPASVTYTPQFAVTSKLLSSTIHNEPVLSPQDAVRSLFLGLPVDLHSFKRLADKNALLAAAEKLGDGNCIAAVLLHLQKTLSEHLLFGVLSNSSVSWHHYAAILEKQNQLKKASELFIHLGKTKEAAVFSYRHSLGGREGNQLTNMQQSAKQLIQKGVGGVELQIIQEHIDLLERQLPIYESDSKLQSEERPQQSSLLGSRVLRNNLVNSSLLATLQYCCQNHWNLAENLLASPAAFKKKFSLTDREYIWSAVIGRTLAGNDPTSILVTKSLLGTPRISASIPVSRVLEVVHSLECNPAVIGQLLPFVENQDHRLALAKRFKSHRAVIEILANQKDRLGLVKYKDVVAADAALLSYLEGVLHQINTKWKN